jgi:hypothetical protein
MKTNIKIGNYITITCSETYNQHCYPDGYVHVTIYYSKTDFNISFRYKGELAFDSLFWFMVGTQIENQKNLLNKKLKENSDTKLYRKHLDSVNTIYIAFQNYFKTKTYVKK